MIRGNPAHLFKQHGSPFRRQRQRRHKENHRRERVLETGVHKLAGIPDQQNRASHEYGVQNRTAQQEGAHETPRAKHGKRPERRHLQSGAQGIQSGQQGNDDTAHAKRQERQQQKHDSGEHADMQPAYGQDVDCAAADEIQPGPILDPLTASEQHGGAESLIRFGCNRRENAAEQKIACTQQTAHKAGFPSGHFRRFRQPEKITDSAVLQVFAIVERSGKKRRFRLFQHPFRKELPAVNKRRMLFGKPDHHKPVNFVPDSVTAVFRTVKTAENISRNRHPAQTRSANGRVNDGQLSDCADPRALLRKCRNRITLVTLRMPYQREHCQKTRQSEFECRIPGTEAP